MSFPVEIAGVPFFALEFGTRGEALSSPQLGHLIAECKRTSVTDLVFLAHGFRCDADDATALYNGLLTNLHPFLPQSATRTFAVAGVYWPSQEFREAPSAQTALASLRGLCPASAQGALDHAEDMLDAVEVSRNAQDQFAAAVLLAIGDSGDDPSEGVLRFHDHCGSKLFSSSVWRKPGASCREGGIETVPFAAPIDHAIGEFLNLMSWTAMKRLAGDVGQDGLAPGVLDCQRELPQARIHLAGHSLGGRLMTACCKALAVQHGGPIDSLSLLQAAFSHYGFSPDAGTGQPGFFRNVITSQIVRGPLISTFSKNDAVVGTAYALASRLAHDRLQAIGDATDAYGGIGHNGAHRTPESTAIPLQAARQPYRFRPGVVTCLDGSAGFITGHGDVTNPHVAWAVASAICGTT